MIVDISYANGKFSWSKASDQNISVAIVKAYQYNSVDAQFITNITSSKTFTNIQKGAYAYLDYTLLHYGDKTSFKSDAIAFGVYQANKFFNIVLPYIKDGTLKITVKDASGNIKDATLWLDIENHYGLGGWESIDSNMDRALKIALAFKTELERLLKLAGYAWKCNIYTNMGIAQFCKNFTSSLLWLAWYTDDHTPDSILLKYDKDGKSYEYYPTGAWYTAKQVWLFHQYLSVGDGILFGNERGNPNIDHNNMNSKYTLVLATTEEPTVPVVELTDTEKLKILWESHYPNGYVK